MLIFLYKYYQMSQVTLTDKINQAISTLNEASGSSVPAIVKFVQSNFKGISAGNVKTDQILEKYFYKHRPGRQLPDMKWRLDPTQ